MTVVYRLPPPSDNVWYLAYGSNLSTTKFIKDRGIVPLSTAVVTVLGWTLTMDSAGFPYSEPAFASITAVPSFGDRKYVQLIGTAYRLSPDMYRKVLASEGGGIAYAEVEIRADVVETDPSDQVLKTMSARSLVTVMRREARPSQRYMNLIRTGAEEGHMPMSYQQYLARLPVYHEPKDGFAKLGASLFLAFWAPVMSLMEKITKSSPTDSEGNVPAWNIYLVRLVMFLMWLYHDRIHAPIWGRGDGMDRYAPQP